MLVLLLVGVVLIVFGGFVLLRRPSAAGGKIEFGGMKVSSTGAGLPLIALGLAAVAIAAGDATDRLPFSEVVAGGTGGASSGGCFSEVPPERSASFEAGVGDQDVIGSMQPIDEPFVLHLTSDAEPLAELKMRYFPDSELFKILGAVTANCDPIEELENESRGGDPRTLENWDTLEFRIDGRAFVVRVGADSGIVSINFFREIAP